MKHTTRIVITAALLLAAVIVVHVSTRARGSIMSDVAVQQMQDSSTAYAEAQLKSDANQAFNRYTIPLTGLMCLLIWAPVIKRKIRSNDERDENS